MSAPGDVLELVFAGVYEPVAVFAQVLERQDLGAAAPTCAAAQHLNDGVSPVVRGVIALSSVPSRLVSRRRSNQPEGPTGESTLSIWRHPSGRLRLERSWQSAIGDERIVTVVESTDRPRTASSRSMSYDHRNQRALSDAGRWPALRRSTPVASSTASNSARSSANSSWPTPTMGCRQPCRH
jgi:hypothetical protein